jgi:hypothetical protein
MISLSDLAKLIETLTAMFKIMSLKVSVVSIRIS